MPSSEKRSEVIVGLFLFLGLALLGALIVQFGRFGDRFIKHYELLAIFDDASGLIKGSEIRMGGAMIGKVGSRPYLDDKLKVRAELRIDQRVRIPVGSKFQINSATLLGDKLVVVTIPEQPTERFIEPDSEVIGSGPSGLEAIQSRAEEFSNDARRLIKEADTTISKLDVAIDDVRVTAQELTKTVQKVNTSLLSEENLSHFDKSLANIEAATTDFSKAGKQLEPALTETRTTIQEVRTAAKEANAALAKAAGRIDEIGPILRDVPQAINSISAVADQAGLAIQQARKGNGLLGTLAYDQGVSTDAKSFVNNLRRYGILRYRDAETKPTPDPRDRFRGHRR